MNKQSKMEKIPFTDRLSFGSTEHVLDYPDFLDIQLESFSDFTQLDIAPEDRKNQGLQKIFNNNFPIQDYRETHILEFMHYSVDTPKYSIKECQERGLSYAVPLKAKLRLSAVDDGLFAVLGSAHGGQLPVAILRVFDSALNAVLRRFRRALFLRDGGPVARCNPPGGPSGGGSGADSPAGRRDGLREKR